VTCASPTSPPTLTIHGVNDTTVDRDQATTLDAKLKEVGAPHQTILLEGVGHSFNLTHTWEKQPLPNDLRPIVIGFWRAPQVLRVSGIHAVAVGESRSLR
jgi:acetyl esterase/lipase